MWVSADRFEVVAGDWLEVGIVNDEGRWIVGVGTGGW